MSQVFIIRGSPLVSIFVVESVWYVSADFEFYLIHA